MESRIMQVFYGNDCLPYKDKERQVHYPVVGNSFTGASDTTKIRFYVKDIGGVENVTWVAVVKLPNGKIGFKVLSAIGNDLEVGERYIEFSLNSFYTQYNGDLAIALKGYQGNIQVEEDDQTGIYEIVGTPTIQATGVIKLSVNYSTQLPLTQGFSPDELIQLMALIAEKLNIASGIVVLLNDDEDISGYTNGQLFYVVSRNQFMQLVENELEEKELKVYDLVPGQQATMSIIANPLTNVNGRVLSAYESTIIIVGGYQCYKITRGGANLTEEYASRYMEYMTGSKYLPKYDYDYPKNTYLITPSGLILKPQYDSTNGLLLFPMSNLATRDYVDNDILEITSTSTPLTYEQRQKISTNNVRIKYNGFLYEKVSQIGHNARFECANLIFTTNVDGSTTISQRFIVARDDTGSIVANVKELDTYSKAQADQYFAHNVEMSVDSNYVLKVKLIDKSGNQLAEDSVDLPLESIVQSAQYYETYTYQGTTYEDVIVITLATTSVPTIIPVGDLVSGLVSEDTYNSGMATKVDKTNSANKVYGTNGSGSQTTFNVDNNVSGNVVRRDSNSQINVPLIPTNSAHASSKDYTDSFAKDLALSLDQSTYVLTVTLKNASGGNIVTRTVDLPLETMVVSGSYDEINQAIILTLKNGQTISIPVGDLISGLVSTDYLQANYYNKTQIDQMVAGFVFADIDDHLSSVSTNPVENRVITLALEEKANVDGNYPTMTVGLADNLNTKIVQNEKEAYLFRTTGGSLEVGNNCKEKAIVGGSLGFNQIIPTISVNATQNGITIYSNNDGKFVITVNDATGYNQVNLLSGTFKQVNGHKYLFSGQDRDNGIQIYPSSYSGLGKAYIYVAPTTSNISVYLYVPQTTPNGTYVLYPMLIDLTAMFGATIADYIYTLEQGEAGAGVAWFRRYFNKSYYPYTAIGAFINVKTSGKKVVGFNQFAGNSTDNPQYIGHYYIDSNDGYQKGANASYNCFRIKVLPNTTYCFVKETGANIGTECIWRFVDEDYNLISGIATGYGQEKALYTTPSNCAYIEFSVGTSATYGLNLNFHYDGERDGEYEPYESNTYPNDDIELIGIPKIDAQGNLYYEGNVYRPDGTVIKKYGIVDLSTETWTYDSTQGYFRSGFSAVKNGVNNQKSNIFSPNFTTDTFNNIYNGVNDKTIGIGSDNAIYIRDTSLNGDTSAITGYLVYELAEETEDSATPYPETQPCDNWGTEERIDTRSIPIPVGHDTDYPLDLKSKLEILPDSPSDDGTYVVKTESGVNTYIPLATWLSDNGYVKPTSITGYDATKTQILKNVEGTLTWVDDE